MNKGKKSLLTAGTAVLLMFLNGLFGLIVTKMVITTYGSDFNGLNSTATQFINMLLIVEGGFTLATNVALFKPLVSESYKEVNRILSATGKIFNKIGIVFLTIGVIVSFGYSILLKSDLSIKVVVMTFLMTVISTAFNLLYAMKYRILLQSEQKEYVLNFIQVGTLVLSQALIIAVVFLKGHMLLVRFVTMIGVIINSLIVGAVCRRNYKFIDFSEKPNYVAISGTKDVFVQKLTSMIYKTLPIVFISATVGTIFASVYIVYNNIFNLLKSVIYAFINAPRMGFGKLIAERDRDYVLKVFLQYEFIVNIVMLTLLSTAAVLIMPFIRIYTTGITDANYYNWYIALLLIGITFFEIIHIPSGNIINMAGKFKVGRKIQSIASIVLILVMIVGNHFIGFYGILLAVFVTAVLLAILEIVYIHYFYFNKSCLKFLRLLVPNFIIMLVITVLEVKYLPTITGYVSFFIAGIVIVIVNGGILGIVNFIFNKEMMSDIFERVNTIIKLKVKKRPVVK